MLRVADAADEAVDPAVAVAGVDENGAYLEAGGLQEHLERVRNVVIQNTIGLEGNRPSNASFVVIGLP